MGLTPVKRALVSEGLPMTYQLHNPWSPRQSGTRQHDTVKFISLISGQETNNLTRVKIRPTGVESKNNMGALKTALVKPEKKALEAFNPR